MPDATAAKMNFPAACRGEAESQTNGEISPAAVPPAGGRKRSSRADPKAGE